METLIVNMVAHSCEITWVATVFICLAIGPWQGYEWGKEHKFKRDAKGRFVS